MKAEIIVIPEKHRVLKVCRTAVDFHKEVRVLSIAFPFIPSLLATYGEKVIEMELLEGETITNKMNLDFFKLAGLFSQLHLKTSNKQKVLCHIDTNPKNYIIDEVTGNYYMIDFSESSLSVPEHDLFNFLLFFAAMYEPERFEKAMICFLNSYKNKRLLDRNRHPLFDQWIDIFDHRREKYRKKSNVLPTIHKRNRKLLRERFYDYSMRE